MTNYTLLMPPPTAGGESNVDGDLTDYTGTQIIPPRRAFDHENPHLRVWASTAPEFSHPNNGEILEFANIPDNVIPNPSGGFFSSGDSVELSSANWNGFEFQDSAIHVALNLAEYLWYYYHGPSGTITTNARPDAVAVGSELDEILIEVVAPSYNPSLLWDPYSFRASRQVSGLTNGIGIYGDNSLPGNHVAWEKVDAANDALRDVIVYGRKPATFPADVAPPTMGEVYINAGWVEKVIDNLRFEHMTITGNGPTETGSECVRIVGAADVQWPYDPLAAHGRLKFYDVQFAPFGAESYTGPPNYGQAAGQKRVFRVSSACWDIRHPEMPLPYPPCWAPWEHFFYSDSLVGPDVYPQLAIDQATSNPRAANVFCNLYIAGVLPPWSGGGAAGAPQGTQRSLIQVVGRPIYHGGFGNPADVYMSSGDLAVFRCDASKHGSWSNNASPAITIYGGLNGRFVLKNFVYNYMGTGQRAGVLFLAQDGVVNVAQGYGPDGRYRLEAEPGRFYAVREVVIDGVYTNAAPNDVREALKLGAGAETIRLIRFDLAGWSHDHITIGDDFAGPQDEFVRQVILDDLEVQLPLATPFAEPFSDYPGFGSDPRVKIKSWRAFLNDASQDRVLTDQDIDNLAGAGGIVAQMYDTLLTDPQIDPTWAPSAYSANDKPAKPAVKWSDVGGAWYSEDEADGSIILFPEALICRQDGSPPTKRETSSNLLLRGIIGLHGTDTTIYVADQVPWQGAGGTQNTWTAISGDWSYTLLKVSGFIVQLDGTVTEELPHAPADGLWFGHYDRAVFRAILDSGASALSSGTKPITLALAAHPSGPPQLEYPPNTGGYEDLTVVGPVNWTANIIPAVDYAGVSFDSASQDYDPANLSDGQTFAIPMTRTAAVNDDAMQLDAAVPVVKGGNQPGSFTVEAVVNWQGTGAQTQGQSLVITIPSAGDWSDGDSIVVTLDIPGSTHANAGAGSLTHTITFTAAGGGFEPFAGNTGLAGAGLTSGDMTLSLGQVTIDDAGWATLVSGYGAPWFTVDGDGWKRVNRVHFTGKVTVATAGVFFDECLLDSGNRFPNEGGPPYALVTQDLAYRNQQGGGSQWYEIQWCRARYTEFAGASIGVLGGFLWAQRCKWHSNTTDHVQVNKGGSHSLIEECYFTGPMAWKSGAHGDVFQDSYDAGGLENLRNTERFIRSKIDWWGIADAKISDAWYPTSSASRYWEIRECWLYGHTVGDPPNGDPDGDGTTNGPNNWFRTDGGDAELREFRAVDNIVSDAVRGNVRGSMLADVFYSHGNRWADASRMWQAPQYAGQLIASGHDIDGDGTSEGFDQDPSYPPPTSEYLPTPSPTPYYPPG